jgi:hypothetical protein
MTLEEQYYILTPREGELPLGEIEARLRAMPEVRAVPTRPPGTYLMHQSAERADIVLAMTRDEAPYLPPAAIYLILDRPGCVVLDLEGSNEGNREVLVGFLEWLGERCPFMVHDQQGRYAHEIDEKGLSAFLFEPWD